MKFKTILGLVVLVFSLTGCINQNPKSSDRWIKSSVDSASYKAVASGPSSEKAYTCSAEPNVIPNYDWDFDGTGFYTVCRSKTKLEELKVYGLAANSKSICMFPIVYGFGNQADSISIYRDPKKVSTVDPASDVFDYCFEAKEDGAVIQGFGTLSYNAVFVVEKQDEDEMKQCLHLEAYALCPRYAFGELN